MTSNIPIGSVVPYAGGALTAQQSQCWYICDGSAKQVSDAKNAALFQAIGTTYGGDGNHTFNLPDLRGRFVRGVGGSVTLGTVQDYATAPPSNPFVAGIWHLPTDSVKGNYGSLMHEDAEWNGGAISVTVTGGDAESRPVNAYVLFIIKYRDSDQAPNYGELPIGALVAMPGINAPDDYLLCNGQQIQLDDPTYFDLYNAINSIHGGDGSSYFNLPDYRGRFLRGVSSTSGNDPDAITRTAPQPVGGNSGNNIGSVQGMATGKPKNNFIATIPHVPNDWEHQDTISGQDGEIENDDLPTGDLAYNGGDKETRPANLAVDWYICYASSTGEKK